MTFEGNGATDVCVSEGVRGHGCTQQPPLSDAEQLRGGGGISSSAAVNGSPGRKRGFSSSEGAQAVWDF